MTWQNLLFELRIDLWSVKYFAGLICSRNCPGDFQRVDEKF